MEEKENSFRYVYSAQQRQEVERIRANYLPPQADKMEQLRTLHRSTARKAQAWAIALGVIGALILGAGMSLVMTDLGQSLGLPGQLAMPIGVAVGLVGLVLVALAYPVYNRMLEKQRQRIAPMILQLTDELLK